MPVQPNPNSIMHASFKIGDTAIMASDGCGDGTAAEFKGFSLSVSAKDEADARRLFASAVRRRPGAPAADQDLLLAGLRHGPGQVRHGLDGRGRAGGGEGGLSRRNNKKQ